VSKKLALTAAVALVCGLASRVLAVTAIIRGDVGTPFSPYVPYPAKNLKPGWTLITPPDDQDYLEYKDDHPGGVTVTNVAGTGIDMHFDVGNHTTLSGRDRTAEFPDAEPLAIDYFMGDDTVTVEDGIFYITLSNLSAGRYAFVFYQNNPAGEGRVDLLRWAIVSGAVSQWVGDSDIPATGELLDARIGRGVVTFTATGAGDVTVALIGLHGPGYRGGGQLNAFELLDLDDVPETIIWTGAGADDSWFTAGNWSTNAVPCPNDAVELSGPPQRGPVIDSEVVVNAIKGPAWVSSRNQVMDVQGGTIVFKSWLPDDYGRGTGTINISGSPHITIDSDWHVTDHGTSVVNISGKPTIVVNGNWRGADGYWGRMEVNMAGGVVSVANVIRIGAAGSGAIDISGGIMTCGGVDLTTRYGLDPVLRVRGDAEVLVEGDIALNTDGDGETAMQMDGGRVLSDNVRIGAAAGSGVLNMAGGLLIVRDLLSVPDCCDGGGAVHLDGGTIRCGDLSLGGSGSLDITGGILVIDGYKLAQVWDFIGASLLTGYGWSHTLGVDYDLTHAGQTTVKTIADLEPRQARNPRPYDTAHRIPGPSGVILSWRAGANLGLGRHYVYFGTDFDAVDSATPSTPEIFKGYRGALETSYDAGVLELWKTYYWRIDEVTSTTVKGRVWRFTTGCELVRADTNRDCTVNFKDLAVLAQTWQQEGLWPAQ
jgi:hypothetical protein